MFLKASIPCEYSVFFGGIAALSQQNDIFFHISTNLCGLPENFFAAVEVEKICLFHPSHHYSLNGLFICRYIWAKCATIYVLAEVHTQLFQRPFYFSPPFVHTHSDAYTHTHTLQKSGLYSSLLSCVFERPWLRYPIDRSNSCC